MAVFVWYELAVFHSLFVASQVCEWSYVFLFHALVEEVCSCVLIAIALAELAQCILRRSTAITSGPGPPPAEVLAWRVGIPQPTPDWVPRSCGRLVADLQVVRVLRKAICVAGPEAISSDCSPSFCAFLMTPSSEEEACLLIALWAVSG